MSEAIFGLIGVVVGSAITWGIEIWRARRSDSDDARVAARLIAAELQSIDNARTVDLPELGRQKVLALEQDAWITHRSTLARELGDSEWRAVRDAYDALALPQRGRSSEDYVSGAYTAAMTALEPLMSSDRRYWWQRIVRRRRHQSATPNDGE
ncbi:MAG: hypothetical protein WKF96_19985 [Solirubrobacteraceae bacterium]